MVKNHPVKLESTCWSSGQKPFPQGRGWSQLQGILGLLASLRLLQTFEGISPDVPLVTMALTCLQRECFPGQERAVWKFGSMGPP